MSMNNVLISRNSKEKRFIADVIASVMNEDAFTSEGHTIVCKVSTTNDFSNAEVITSAANVGTKMDEVFPTSNTEYFYFWFVIDSNAIISFARSANGQTNSYTVTSYFGGVYPTGNITNTLRYSNAVTSVTETALRTWKYQIFSNANVLYIIFGTYEDTETFPLQPKDSQFNYTKTFQAFSYKNSGEWFGGLYCDAMLYDASGVGSTLINRLEYFNNATDPTDVEIIQSKVAKQSNGVNKTVTMSNLYDSSYNSAVKFPVSINNASYVYLNNYTLMPI